MSGLGPRLQPPLGEGELASAACASRLVLQESGGDVRAQVRDDGLDRPGRGVDVHRGHAEGSLQHALGDRDALGARVRDDVEPPAQPAAPDEQYLAR